MDKIIILMASIAMLFAFGTIGAKNNQERKIYAAVTVSLFVLILATRVLLKAGLI